VISSTRRTIAIVYAGLHQIQLALITLRHARHGPWFFRLSAAKHALPNRLQPPLSDALARAITFRMVCLRAQKGTTAAL
jgi:hypothetical protein